MCSMCGSATYGGQEQSAERKKDVEKLIRVRAKMEARAKKTSK